MAGIIWTASQFEPVKPAEPTAGAERQVVVERTLERAERAERDSFCWIPGAYLLRRSTLQAPARMTGNRWTDECEYIPLSNYELARLSQLVFLRLTRTSKWGIDDEYDFKATISKSCLATAMVVKVSYFATSDRMFQLRSMFHDGTKIVSKIYTFKAIQLQKR
ncbi:hypothetical protein V1478_003121 [Vespula squamosa]|uniref:Uncharacterized protein n=1 Tax=Vespula squamosa TaxID=30214 RepID=A0ABD2BRT3_VESSQ